jgi:hypothetical protein
MTLGSDVNRCERTGVVVIRVWIETATETDRLRARITLVRDLAENAPETAVASDRDEIVAVVRRFVDEFAAGGDARVTLSPETRPR